MGNFVIPELILTKNTGVVGGNYPSLPQPSSAKAYMQSKIALKFENLAYVRQDGTGGGGSPITENWGCVHIPIDEKTPKISLIDFVCYTDPLTDIYIIGAVTGITRVNWNTVRITFALDPLLTYFHYDMVVSAMVERMHPVTHNHDSSEYLEQEESSFGMQTTFDKELTEQVWAGVTSVVGSELGIAIFLSSDKLGNSNSPDVSFNMVANTPFWGTVFWTDKFEVATNYFKSYMDNNGIEGNTAPPLVSNMVACKYMPEFVAKASSQSAAVKSVDINLTPPKVRWAKMLSPHFLKYTVVGVQSNQSFSFDAGTASVGVDLDKVHTEVKIQAGGGVNAEVGVFFNANEDYTAVDKEHEDDADNAAGHSAQKYPATVSSTDQITNGGYPDIEVNTFLPDKNILGSYFHDAVPYAAGAAAAAASGGLAYGADRGVRKHLANKIRGSQYYNGKSKRWHDSATGRFKAGAEARAAVSEARGIERGGLRAVAGAAAAWGAEKAALVGAANLIPVVGEVVDAAFLADMAWSALKAGYKLWSSSYGGVSRSMHAASSSLAVSAKRLYFIGLRDFIHPNDVGRANNYFDMYGYAVRRQCRPQFAEQPNFNFVQTSGGFVWDNTQDLPPAVVLGHIEEFLNSGIRFWQVPIGSTTEAY